jgi:YD repeat-containing protein
LANTNNTDTANTTAEVLDAPLSNGDPVAAGPGTQFFGGNQGNATSAGAALSSFEAAIGGVKNTAAAPQSSGFRVINWDGVKVDGTDAAAGPNSTTVITPGHTVGIPLDRFQGSGVFFGAVYAVSNDGFTDVNPSVAGLFPAFSTPNTFAMFNDNGIDFTFIAPSSTNTAPVSAASRGFGSIFLNVQQPGTTIQYFHGNTLIDTLNVPTNPTPGAAVFAGELFNNPEVTNVLLTLGQGVIFKFDGTTIAAGGANSATNNLVAVDDWVLAEPVPIVNGTGIPVSAPIQVAPGTLNAAVLVNATAGQSFTGVAAVFSDADPNAIAKDFTASINWGDGHSSNGTIVADGHGGFNVMGTNTYATGGLFSIAVQIQDFGSSFFTVTNTAKVVTPPVTTGNLNFTETPQGFFGLSGLLVQPLASNNQPVGPSLNVPSLLSVLLTLNLVKITSLNRDASGNVVIAINFAGTTIDLDYNGAGQLTGATVLGMPFPVNLL